MKRKCTIGLVQAACSRNQAENLEYAIGQISEAAQQGAQIICLQELFNGPYFCTVEDEKHFDLAEPIPGPTTEQLQKTAQEHQVVLIVPLFERRAPGMYHNSAVVIDADGALLGTYRKMHIPDDPMYYEKFFFTPGDSEGEHAGYRVFKTRYATIGVLICWDQWYPEPARITSLLGAEILFFPTAIGWHPFEKDEFGEDQYDAWLTMQRSHAIANGVFVASVNRVGHEETPGTEGIEFFGRSFICDPFGRKLAQAPTGKPGLLLTECDFSRIEETRRMWPFLRDRRIDSYHPLEKRLLD